MYDKDRLLANGDRWEPVLAKRLELDAPYTMIASLAFYLFAAVLVASRRHGRHLAQPGAFGAVPDPRLLQRGRAVPDRRRRVPGDDPGHRLRRRRRGAVPLRGDDAGHRLRRSCARASSATPPSAPSSAASCSSNCSWCSAPGPSRPMPATSASRPPPGGVSNTEALGRHPLHGLHLPVPGRRPDPAGRHDRRHRADLARQAGGTKRQVIATQLRAGRASLQMTQPSGAGHRRDGILRPLPPPVKPKPPKQVEPRGAPLMLAVGLAHYLTVGAILFVLGSSASS